MLDELTPRHEEDTEMRRAELKELSINQLMDLNVFISGLIVEKGKEQRASAVERIKKIAADIGCKPQDLFGAEPNRRSPAKIKYRFPDGSTWTGKGRMPIAAKAYLEGVDADDDKEARDQALAQYMVE